MVEAHHGTVTILARDGARPGPLLRQLMMGQTVLMDEDADRREGPQPTGRQDRVTPYAIRTRDEAAWRAYRRRFTLRVPLFIAAPLGAIGALLTLIFDNTVDAWVTLALGVLAGWLYGVLGSWFWAAKYYYR